jgi:hypothetical protein
MLKSADRNLSAIATKGAKIMPTQNYNLTSFAGCSAFKSTIRDPQSAIQCTHTLCQVPGRIIYLQN